jgi:hypothetical protein
MEKKGLVCFHVAEGGPCPARADGEESLSDFLGEMDELFYSVYLGSELIVIDTRTVDGPGVF